VLRVRRSLPRFIGLSLALALFLSTTLCFCGRLRMPSGLRLATLCFPTQLSPPRGRRGRLVP